MISAYDALTLFSRCRLISKNVGTFSVILFLVCISLKRNRFFQIQNYASLIHLLIKKLMLMDESKKNWFKSLPKWLKILVAILMVAVCTIYSLTSCGNTKVLLRNAHTASVSQQGSDIEVVISTQLDSLSFGLKKKDK